MNESIKQAMHLDACKSFGAAEANENERRWDDKMIDSKNNDSINNYDKTRMRLNFEIGPDGKIHSLGYQDKRLDVRLQERLNELGWRPFKADSKIQPNCCARLIFGGNRERTLGMAFGTQDLKLDKGSDNSHIHRCKEVEQWALDVYNWCCRRYGKENIIGFQVHLDETSPHIHALIVPVGVRPKSGRECVMWSAKFGKNKYEYGSILKEMHTSLYEEVGSKYGLERGDSVEGRNIQHLNKRDYIRKLAKEQKKMEKAIRGLQTMKDNIEAEMKMFSDELKILEKDLAAGRVVLAEYQNKKACIEDLIHDCQERLDDKETKLMIKQQELDSLLKDIQNIKYVNMFNRGIQRVKNLLQENGNPEPVFNVDKITAFEVIVRPSLSLNLVTDEENVTKSVTKLSDTLNDIIDFCSTPRSMAEIMEHLGLKHRYNVKHRYIDPLIEGGFLVMTIPEKPNSRSQKYKRALT